MLIQINVYVLLGFFSKMENAPPFVLMDNIFKTEFAKIVNLLVKTVFQMQTIAKVVLRVKC